MADVAELARLAALERLSILDTPHEPLFDSFVTLVAESFGVPVALISLVDQDRQWFKAIEGLPIEQTARAVAFCDHTIQSSDVLVVADATRDPRFRDNPLVTGDPHIRFYAGAPLVAPDGYHVGTLSLIAFKPRLDFPASEAQRLTGLARSVMLTLTQRALALQTERFSALAAERLELLAMAERMSGVGSWSWDATTGQIQWSDECRIVHGGADAPPPSKDYRHVLGEYYPEDQRALTAALKVAVEGDEPFDLSVRRLGGDSAVRWLSLHGVARRNANRELLGLYGTVQDRTEAMRQEAVRDLLMLEVDHRARNVLSVVQSVLQLTRAPDVASFKERVLGRVSALARAQKSLTERGWRGGSAKKIVEDELTVLAMPSQISIKGEDMPIAARDVQPLAMIVHELATNAVKHGALSVPTGSVRVTVARRDNGLEIEWREIGGPRLTYPAREGFGSRMIRELSTQLGAEFVVEWNETGLACKLKLPPTRMEDTLEPSAWISEAATLVPQREGDAHHLQSTVQPAGR